MSHLGTLADRRLDPSTQQCPPLSHTGFDAVKLPGGAKFHVGDFHHQLHHRFLDCNYGGLESPLDPLLGVFHDGTPQADAALRQRRQRNR